MRFVETSEQLKVAVHDFGGDGHPVLAAHATGFNGRIWLPVAEALSTAHVVAPDFRGHGRSPVPVDYPFVWDRFADDVLATLDAFGWLGSDSAPVGIGHSMGGAALLLAEIRRPGTFKALWLFEPITFPPEIRAMMADVDNPLAEGAKRRRPRFPSKADAIGTFGSKPPMNTFTTETLTAYVEGGFEVDEDGEANLLCLPENEARVYDGAMDCTAFENLDAVTCPTVVLRGAETAASPAAVASLVASALPKGRLLAHDSLSHFGPMEAPGEMAASIAELF